MQGNKIFFKQICAQTFSNLPIALSGMRLDREHARVQKETPYAFKHCVQRSLHQL